MSPIDTQNTPIKPYRIEVPELCIVMLVGISGAGKSSFAHRHFLPTEVVSSDTCRGMISDDENNQKVTAEAFDLVYTIAEKRLSHGKLTVLDATHVQPGSRQGVLKLAKSQNVLCVAIVLDLPLEVCKARNTERPDRQFGDQVLHRQQRQLRQTCRSLRKEGFHQVYTLKSLADVERVEMVRRPLWNNKKHEHGPFDIIGDVHGCCDELETLLQTLGYVPWEGTWKHPAGRRAFFVGDLIDRGPRNLDSLFLARDMVAAGQALCVPGNHENKFARYVLGKKVKQNHGLEKTVAEIEALPETEQARVKEEARQFIESLISHYVLDDGKLVVAHAGLKENYHGRTSGKVRSFALYGDTTGEIDSFGLPVRLDWAADYRGEALVVYGHVPVPEAEFLNNTIDIDTGCVFGGKLTALRYPEREIVSVPSQEVYYEPVRPLAGDENERSGQHQLDDVLYWSEVAGKQFHHTQIRKTLSIQASQAAAALEVVSRFAVDPRWLIYLPPTMSPTETASHPDYLEHPHEALEYYRKQGLKTVICQQKHMGSRAVIVVCKTPQVAVDRFGLEIPSQGCIYTRTGRAFFQDQTVEQALLGQLAQSVESAGLWQRLNTDWLVLDSEILPWSAKAGDLIRQQYAAVGAAATGALAALNPLLQKACERLSYRENADVQALRQRHQDLAEHTRRYQHTVQGYCWPTGRAVGSGENPLAGIQIAPFHLLASEGEVHVQRSHLWHMEQLHHLAIANPELLVATPYHQVNLQNAEDCEAITQWWLEQTANGHEGMVVKPFEYLSFRGKDYLQPALKCRGREYLRMIYGPDYTQPMHLERLKKRSLGRKRSLAMRELALGIEGLTRFVQRKPLREIHACAVGVLALESEPVDPRL